MKPINTVPVELFSNKVKVARRKGHKMLMISIDEAEQLDESMSVIVSRLCGELDTTLQKIASSQSTEFTVKMDGGAL